ncbi:MAG: NAD(P)/FAD-dependent oxidoreductase [Synergistaceae bacterium]|jgi:NADPH-dependent 2,4-dienoyl-CoA reductase/sulfur reductase-like enzyme|nr:NAD(P)/FAD-dependent oxidoreductase [Synergistaceae bacterium]
MREIAADVAVIGGGPAGMAAALKASDLGATVALVERDPDLGGILNQCVHDGFGLIRFGRQMSGAEYAQVFADRVYDSPINVMTGTTVLKLQRGARGFELHLTGEKTGAALMTSGAVILAMGCRERTRPQVRIMGTRPAGVLTAGAVQKYINIEGYLPGRRAVILGSGDIGLIMARRMTLEGMEVAGVYEIMPSPGGLRRNIAQCLDDYGIPLHLSTTVRQVHGNRRVEGVTVARVEESGGARRAIPGSEKYVACDLLVLSVGLIPENELSRNAGVEMNPITGGPELDNMMMTSIPGVFAAGNVSAVFDLVDYVSDTGERAAEGACGYLSGDKGVLDCIPPIAGDGVSFVVPGRIRRKDPASELYLRVKRTIRGARLEVSASFGGKPDEIIAARNCPIMTPPEMATVSLPSCVGEADRVTVRVVEG